MAKNILSFLIIFCFVAGLAGSLNAWQGAPSTDTKRKPGAAPGMSQFDETATQYLKRLRSLNADLVAAHQEQYKYMYPDTTGKGMNLDDIMSQQDAARDKQRQDDMLRSNKSRVEDKINALLKDRENLKEELTKHYGGTLPSNVASAWKMEEDYTEYRISKYR